MRLKLLDVKGDRFMATQKTKRTIVILVGVVLQLALYCAVIAVCIYSLQPIGGVEASINIAIKIARERFGCDEILWTTKISNFSGLISDEDAANRFAMTMYVYGVVGKNNGKETLVIVPSFLDIAEPCEAQWQLDYSFTDIVSRLQSEGVIREAVAANENCGKYSEVIEGCSVLREDNEQLYDRLDIKFVFKLNGQDGSGNFMGYTVWQENHKLVLSTYDSVTHRTTETILAE